MAEINTKSGGREKRNKPRKMSLHVDFTPMVDMNMLLLCFFMFCTTLNKPQIMDLVMPADDQGQRSTLTPASKSLTLILDDKDNVYYYHGFPDYEDCTSLQNTSYSNLRNVLLEKNSFSVDKIRQLKQQFANKEVSEDQYKKQIAEIRKSDDGITVMIKPTKNSSYRHLVDALDEMQICNIGKYVIMEMAPEDDFLLENLLTKGSLTAIAK